MLKTWVLFKILFFLFFLMNNSISLVNSQTVEIANIPDSIQTKIKNADNIDKIKIYIKLAHDKHEDEPLMAVKYAKTALNISERTGVPKYQADALFLMGLVYYQQTQYDKALVCFERTADLRGKLGEQSLKAIALNRIGNTYQLKGSYNEALKHYKVALSINEQLNKNKEIARNLTNMGSVYQLFGDYNKAIDYHLESLETYEKMGDKEGMAWSYLNIGRLFKKMEDYQKALQYVNNSLALYDTINDKTGVTLCFKEKGIIYHDMNNPQKALNFSNIALKINKKAGNEYGIASVLSNIGNIYFKSGDFDEAEDYYERSLALKEKLGDKIGKASVLRYMGRIYQERGKPARAIQYFKESLSLAKKQNLNEDLREDYLALSKIYAATGSYKDAYLNYIQYAHLKDSLNVKAITKKEMQYDFDKKQHILELEKKQKEIELDKQKFWTNAFIGGFILMIALAFFIYRNYKKKQEINKKLAEQNEEIQAQRDEIEAQRNLATQQRDEITKQKELITDSISYASKIQNAVLPQNDYIDKVMQEHFILYRPRDIVSGDFYWLSQRNDKLVIAAADCTGHGVPGAFMSMLGVSFLNEIVNKSNVLQANEILDKLRINVISSLHQAEKEGQPKDGMDIALCIIDKKNGKMQFSGAHNPAYFFRDGELIELKGDRMPIGIHIKHNDKPFENHEIDIQKGDSIYLFSDGFTDQLGGGDRRKFTKKRLREELANLQNKTMAEQKVILNNALEKWRGDVPQIDDVLMVGIKI
jgi:serine phosphatase RsbU (regulator of sigma subunit)/uncharacterized protein HemY